jgi:hypothetical protein
MLRLLARRPVAAAAAQALRPATQLSQVRSLCAASGVPRLAEQHPFARPQPWMGAWYSLRGEDDQVMQKNRELKKGRRAPTRAKHIMHLLGRSAVRASEEAAPWRTGLFSVGDTIEVEHRPSMSDKPERVVGLCIARYRRG